MLALFVSSFMLGILFNATPGAIFSESLRRGIRGGFGPAFAVQIGSLAGDFMWAVLGLSGAAALFTLPLVELPLSMGGGILLAWLALQAMREGFSPVPSFDASASRDTGKSALAVGAALSISNPMNITYWAGLGATVASLGVDNPGWQAFVVFLMGFMMASVLWCFICAGAIAATRRFVGPRLWLLLNVGAAIGLAYFAVTVLMDAIRRGTS